MADPVVFVPGLACTAELFAHQIAALSDSRRSIVADHTGHADLPSIAASILSDAPDRFVLAGLSMGGYLCFEILRQEPARVSALVLMDTTARPDAPEATERRRRFIAIAEAGRFKDIAGMMMPLLVAPSRVADPALAGIVSRMMDDTGPEAFARQQAAIIARPDSRPLLGRIDCPTLVVVGDEDQITPPSLAAEMAAGIRGARLETVKACGHLSTIERPGAVTGILTDFLKAGGG